MIADDTLLDPEVEPRKSLRSQTSFSALSEHRTCPQRWYYNRVLRLERAEHVPAVERDFGSWWHALRAVDALQRGAELSSLRLVPEKITATEHGAEFNRRTSVTNVLSAAAMIWNTRMRNEQEAWAAVLGESLPDRLTTLYARWRAEWDEEIRTEKPLAVEARWTRSLPLYQGEDIGVRLLGYVDEVYQDTRRGLIVVRDHKTSKTLGTQTAADDMMDSQLQLYAWGISPEVTSWGLGPISATAYDRTRVSRPKTPAVTQAGSLSKSVSDYDLATYLAWAAGPDGQGVEFPGRKKDGSDSGRYVAEEAVIERLSSPAARSAWFQRTLVPLNINLIRSHLKSAIETALDTRRTLDRAEEVREASRNFGRVCNWCDFQSLCRAQMMGGPKGEYPLEDHGLRSRVAPKPRDA